MNLTRNQIVAGVALGVAAVAVAGILTYKNRSKTARLRDAAYDGADEFRGKLKSAKRRAKKEYDRILENSEDFVNQAKERASQWASQARANS